MTIQQALHWARSQLSSSTDVPALEAQILLSEVLGVTREHLFAWPEKPLAEIQYQHFSTLIQRRLQGEPIAYILGRAEFWSLELKVTSDTLIPRPETELLVESLLKILPSSHANIADLGTGSGALALAIASERPHWQVDATDKSLAALQIAQDNAQRLNIPNVNFYAGDWCQALPLKKYHAMVSNPPYIAETEWACYSAGLLFEPRMALTSGADGLEAIRIIIHQAKDYLVAGGYLMIEHGYEQGQAIRAIFKQENYQSVETLQDIAGKERVTCASL